MELLTLSIITRGSEHKKSNYGHLANRSSNRRTHVSKRGRMDTTGTSLITEILLEQGENC
jgi:hypothetical protein